MKSFKTKSDMTVPTPISLPESSFLPPETTPISSYFYPLPKFGSMVGCHVLLTSLLSSLETVLVLDGNFIKGEPLFPIVVYIS